MRGNTLDMTKIEVNEGYGNFSNITTWPIHVFTIGFLMISYFIAAYCTFTTNFSSKLKSQFLIIFGQDSFPLKMSSFQVSLLHNFKNCLLPNGWWNTCFSHYSFFTKKFPISSGKLLVCHKIFLFCQTDSFCGLPWLFFCNH